MQNDSGSSMDLDSDSNVGVWLSDEQPDEPEEPQEPQEQQQDPAAGQAGNPLSPDPMDSELEKLLEEELQQQLEHERKAKAAARGSASAAPAPDNEPGLPSAGEAAHSEVHRTVRPETIPSWGPGFRITYRRPKEGKDHGAWQGTCVFHAKSSVTKCTKTLTMLALIRHAASACA